MVNFHVFFFFLSSLQSDKGDEELCSVYVPTNHLYIGDIFLVNSEEIIRPNLSIREGIGVIPLHLSVSAIFFVPWSPCSLFFWHYIFSKLLKYF